MKKTIKGMVIGFLVGCVLMTTTPVLANSIIQTIDVVFNDVNLKVNGELVQANNILYNGTTYVPLREVATLLDKEVGWDQASKTASINDGVATETTVMSITTESVTINTTEGDKVNDFRVYQSDGSFFAEKNGETYYSISHVIKLMRNYGAYEIDTNKYTNENVVSLLNKDSGISIDNVSYEMMNDIIFISQTYYESSILPLIK